MESQYHHFGSSDNSSVHGEPKMTTQTGVKRFMVHIMYGVLLLLLLILLMVTSIKFSHLNKDITDVKLKLEGLSSRGAALSGPTAVQDVLVKEITPARGTCRENWVSFQRGCYLLSTSKATWSKAEQQCVALGGHLVVLNNVEELDYISEIVEIRHNYWIGLVEREHEGHWSWVDGTDFSSTPTFWDRGQPDDWDYRENGEDCGQLHASERRKRKLWNDADCNLLYHYICESKV